MAPTFKLEQWLPVNGFEGRYEVSSFGRVRSVPRWVKRRGKSCLVPGQILAFGHSGKYLSITIGQQIRWPVHRLVALHFCPNPHNHPQVLHRDDNKKNNHADNLYWGTKNDNARDKAINGLAGGQILTAKEVQEIRAVLADKATLVRQGKRDSPVKALAEEYGVSPWAIHSIRQGKTWGHLK